jgi:hypothetical protein
MLKKLLIISVALGFLSTSASAQNEGNQGNEGNGLLGPSTSPSDNPYNKQICQIPQATLGKFQGALNSVVQLNNGGIFSPNMIWLAVVDRAGTLCLAIKSTVPGGMGLPVD